MYSLFFGWGIVVVSKGLALDEGCLIPPMNGWEHCCENLELEQWMHQKQLLVKQWEGFRVGALSALRSRCLG